MTPEQLAVERDWLLEHGRTPGEVDRMQALADGRGFVAIIADAAVDGAEAVDGYLPLDDVKAICEKYCERIMRLSHRENTGASTPRLP